MSKCTVWEHVIVCALCVCSLFDLNYLSAGLLVSLLDLLPLLVAPFHQNFNDGVLIHTCTRKECVVKQNRLSFCIKTRQIFDSVEILVWTAFVISFFGAKTQIKTRVGLSTTMTLFVVMVHLDQQRVSLQQRPACHTSNRDTLSLSQNSLTPSPYPLTPLVHPRGGSATLTASQTNYLEMEVGYKPLSQWVYADADLQSMCNIVLSSTLKMPHTNNSNIPFSSLEKVCSFESKVLYIYRDCCKK